MTMTANRKHQHDPTAHLTAAQATGTGTVAAHGKAGYFRIAQLHAHERARGMALKEGACIKRDGKSERQSPTRGSALRATVPPPSSGCGMRINSSR